MEPARIVKTGYEARKAIQNGITTCFDIVKSTLGPGGKNVIVRKTHLLPPYVSNDGVFIARNIHLDDECENDALQSFVEAASETNEKAGDGTTSTIVIAGNIINQAFDKIGEFDIGQTQTAREMQKEINAGKEQAVEHIKKAAKKVKNKKELAKIARVSAEDNELGDMISDIVWQVGTEGYIDVTEGYNGYIEHEVIQGMKIDGKFPHRAFVTNENRRQMEGKDLPVFLTDSKLDNIDDMSGILEQMYKNGYRQMLLMAHNFTDNFIANVLRFIEKSKMKVYCVKVPSLTTPQWDDVAAYTNAKHFNENAGDKFKDFQLSDLGHVDKVVATEDDVILTGGKGDTKERIQSLKDEITVETVKPQRRLIERRIGSLSAGVAVIKVGSSSEVESKYLKLKVEDAVYAAKAALEEGYVEGGGLTLKKIADEMYDGMVKEALKAPYEQIQENAGGNVEITEDIVDPAKVVRLAVENACSVAGTMITADSIIADKRDRTMYDGLKAVNETLQEGAKVKRVQD